MKRFMLWHIIRVTVSPVCSEFVTFVFGSGGINFSWLSLLSQIRAVFGMLLWLRRLSATRYLLAEQPGGRIASVFLTFMGSYFWLFISCWP